jgi:phosphopantothenoylcysteine decarboxylase/phosphopantothenate--cysteine ligase
MVCAPMKKILLIGSGSIAIIKLPALIRLLRKEGHELRLVLTGNATRFISPLTFEALLDHPVYEDMFARRDSLTHISLRKWADMVVLVPATANIIAKAANGIADDLASAVLLGAASPRFVCPAMNDAMWAAPATQRNIALLKADGWTVLGPAHGELACGDTAAGRLLEPEEIARAIQDATQARNDCGIPAAAPTLPSGSQACLPGKIIITAGATQEDIDAVRFISNRSSGRMGAALAEAARGRFQEVVFIHAAITVPRPSGSVSALSRVRCVEALSAQGMLQAVRDELEGARALVMAAAIADYMPAAKYDKKLKKKGGDTLDLHLIPTPDILRETADERLARGVHTTGFALESDALIAYAQQKLREKSLDAIVANPLGEEGAGFGTDTNRAVYITREGTQARNDRGIPAAAPTLPLPCTLRAGSQEDWPLMSKREMADRVIDRVIAALGMQGA